MSSLNYNKISSINFTIFCFLVLIIFFFDFPKWKETEQPAKIVRYIYIFSEAIAQTSFDMQLHLHNGSFPRN